MAHLHEVLAVDKALAETAWKVVAEAVVTLTKKLELFTGHDKRYEAFDELRQKEVEGLNERKEITTTVPDKLDYVSGHVIRFLDALAQKELTNQEARADVVLPDGTVILSGVPATLLLALEGNLAKLRALYNAIPTLQPGINWVKDAVMGAHIYRARHDIVKQRTEKVPRYKVLYEATKEHPAQVEKWIVDEPMAESYTVVWSGMVSPSQKATLLRRLDDLINSVKQARMRANEQEVVGVDTSIGGILLGYIHGNFDEQF